MSSNADWNGRLSDRAKKILRIADEEARRLKHAVVKGEHLLLGLIKEGTGVASNVLRNLNVDLGSLEQAVVEKLNPAEIEPESVEELARAERYLQAATEEARELNHEHVGTEDLLLGILSDTKGIASSVLNKFGVQLDAARKEVQRVLDLTKKSGSAKPAGRPSTGPPANEGQIDLSEKGRGADGQQSSLNRRLFMQFMSFTNVNRSDLVKAFQDVSAQAVVYQDINDSRGFGIMFFCEDPAYLVEEVQPVLNTLCERGDASLQQKHEFTMLGRTYSIGYENDLQDVLIDRPVRRLCDPETPWAIYYPLRRSGLFERESKDDQRKMLSEHGGIGHAFGKAGFATDIRLACHGLNTNDNDFIVGLLGKDLFPLSAVVQRMRRTRQTSEFIENMGPFFIGRAVWQPRYESLTTIK